VSDAIPKILSFFKDLFKGTALLATRGVNPLEHSAQRPGLQKRGTASSFAYDNSDHFPAIIKDWSFAIAGQLEHRQSRSRK